ncbi:MULTISPECIES: hypothetical protein [unclassified Bordetella]|uniref:hypothetical protein n=1 Tax=unclassified Bordetella TaxID=2630031 RepID=UPI001321E765|nr:MULTISPECIES: hypothetical protein [unclassified Bordetella]MVW73484.1 hypothetical protein [Bordetella sp. 15P40C-2]MVW77417.1 hypothetical protein [Bordetella sp. 02P26C-1]
MKPLRPALRFAVLAATGIMLAACANGPSRQPDPVDYRADPTPPDHTQSGQRLTIQAGEGEKLNLPWFVQDAENWVNSR